MSWEKLRESYDHVAAQYERAFCDELDAKPRDRELLAAFGAAVSDPVIEVGCGPGQVGAYVRDCGRQIIGVDLSHEMALRASARLAAAAVADMRALPLADRSAGGLLAFYALIHVRRSELEAVLRDFWRVLKPGGRVLISAHEGTGEIRTDEFLGAPVPFVATCFGLGELCDAAAGAGLDVTLAERRAPYPSEHPTVRLYLEAMLPL